MKQRTKCLVALVLALSMLPGLAACGTQPSGTGTTAQPAGTTAPQEGAKQVENLVIGTTTANDTFNLLSQSGAFGRCNYNCLANGDFVYRDAENKLKPYFLKSFELSEDGRTLRMTYPTDAIWHDGKPVTEEDMVFTFTYKRDVMNSAALKNLTEIKPEGAGELTLVFSEPDAYAFLAQGAGNNNCVIPKHIWQNITDYKDYAGEDAMIGCGPYKLVRRDVDAGLSYYEAVPQNAFLGKLTVDSITVRSYSTQDTLLMAMANGEVDVMFDYANPIDVTLLGMLDGNDAIDLGESDYAGNYQVTFGMERAPGNDLNFREAVAKALNWELVCQAINGAYGQIPGRGILTPSCLGYDASLPKMARDTAEAAALLDKAGYRDTNGDGLREDPDGKPLSVKVTPQFSGKKQELLNRIADIMMASLAEVGVNSYIDKKSLQSSEIWEATVIDGDYDLFIGYTTSGMAKYSSAFRYYAACDREGKDEGSTWLWGTYHDKAFNDLIWDLSYSSSEDVYLKDIAALQKTASDTLFGFALCWERCFYPYRTDKYQGFDNWSSWGVVNPETFYTITGK